MDLKQIEYFLRVAERRSFSRAAEMLDAQMSLLLHGLLARPG